MAGAPPLELTGVAAGYAGARTLSGVTLAVAPGENVILLGPNGSGKTTLLRCAAGALRPQEGTVRLGGESAHTLSARARARLVAVLPQQPERPRGLSVRDLVLLGRYPWLSWSGVYSRADHAAAARALAAVDAAHLAGRPVETLSGGEWQRALLARSLAQMDGVAAPLFLLDELTASLDPARAEEVFALLDERRKGGAALLQAAHDCNLAARHATRLMGLKAGRILFDGPVAAVFTEENLSALYDLPLTVFRHPDGDIPQALPALAARAVPAPAPAVAGAGRPH
ncbi:MULTISPECIES: ABC transporter ATP-binding protein [unclassified Desulfovibrio]|uniref:ABC transporter ATP-binding protein n=1 Tax=unclassified Desulfovibrio TaxID=2593640 RepID=UPI001F151046|nr:MULTISPECIES: ABC transporter ATP-binding protein [unclassified Desulfovibrio]